MATSQGSKGERCSDGSVQLVIDFGYTSTAIDCFQEYTHCRFYRWSLGELVPCDEPILPQKKGSSEQRMPNHGLAWK